MCYLPWTIRDVIKAAVIVVISLIGLVFSLAVVAVIRRDIVSDLRNASLLLGVAAFAEAQLFLVTVLFTVVKYRQPWACLGFRPSRVGATLPTTLVVLAGLAINVVYVSLVRGLGLDFLMPQPLPRFITQQGPAGIVFGLIAVVIAPLAEEAFFRAFAFTAAAQRYGAVRGAIISSVLFSLAHFQIAGIVPFFLLGMLLVWLYLRTSSIWSCVIAHLAYNFLVLAVT